jgi:hemolysin activation/secretion protein
MHSSRVGPLLLLCALALAGAAAAAEGNEQHFEVREYRVIGNTVLDQRQVEKLLYPLLGPGKSLTDIEAARTALEELYHSAGYGTVFVDIPPQKVADGLVRLRVTEGRIEQTRISGAQFFAERDVIAQLPAAAPGQVLQVSKLQQQLTAVNAGSPDRSVVPVLKAGSEPGTVDLALQVNDHLPLHGSLELNNQATLDTRSLRSVASLSYGDLFGRLDTLSFQYQASPQQFDQVRVIAANYVAHPLESGWQPSLTYINSNSNVATVGALGVLGIGEITSIRLSYPVAGSDATLQSFSIGADYKHFRNTINQNATTALDTPISYVNLSLAYSGLWRAPGATTTLSLSANAGPRGVVNNPAAFENDRAGGHANYFYLRGDAATDLKLPENFTLRLRAAGQVTAEPLITNENFSIAGVDGVRGYLESEELGDKGIKETIQLTTPPWRDGPRTLGDFYVFLDHGRTWLIDALPGEDPGITLRSWGAGFDLLPGQTFTSSLSWARVAATASTTQAGQSRVLFLVRGTF